jgi:hypothetical protein
MQKEKTRHAVLKAYEDPDEDHHEIPIGNYIADIYCRETESITEIQTANMNAMRDKLTSFLPLYPVKIVYPIPYRKWVTWIDPETGELTVRNKSTRKGSFYQAFRELYKIRPFLTDHHLSIDLILLDMEEYRLQDGWSRDKKRGSHRYDRVPVSIVSEILLERPEDYMIFLPPDLPEPFDSKTFAACAGIRGDMSSTILLMLTELGVAERIGKKGRSYLYRVRENEGEQTTEQEKADSDNVQKDNVQSTKILKNGQIYIMYEGKMYDVQGRRIE